MSLTDSSITCIDCGVSFIRQSLYHGNYCSQCRTDASEIEYEQIEEPENDE